MSSNRTEPTEAGNLSAAQLAAFWRAKYEELSARLKGLEDLYDRACRERDLLAFRPGDETSVAASARWPATSEVESIAGPRSKGKPYHVIEPRVVYEDGLNPPAPAAPFKIREYGLFCKRTPQHDGAMRLDYFFSWETQPDGEPCALPRELEVLVDPKTGTPSLRGLSSKSTQGRSAPPSGTSRS